MIDLPHHMRVIVFSLSNFFTKKSYTVLGFGLVLICFNAIHVFLIW